jgi:hypothetical protein
LEDDDVEPVEEELPFVDPDDVTELPFAAEEDVTELPQPGAPMPVDLPALGPFGNIAVNLRGLASNEAIRAADPSGLAIKNVLEFASALEGIKHEQVDSEKAVNLLKQQLEPLISSNNPETFLSWFGEAGYRTALLYLNAVLGHAKKVRSRLNLNEIWSSAPTSSPKLGELGDDDGFYHF